MVTKYVSIALILLLLILSAITSIATLNFANASTKRVVLAELFTATWCQYCPNSTSAINRLANEDGSSQLLVLQYHPTDSDPLGCNQSADRISYYGVNGFPTIVFDGTNQLAGGLPSNYDDYTAAINSEAQKPSDVSILLTGTITDFTANITSSISQTTSATLRLIIYEDNISYVAPNGENNFRFTARSVLDSQDITLVPNQAISIHRTFQPQTGWNSSNLGIVAFIQKNDTKEILQAATLSKPAPTFTLTITGNPTTALPNEVTNFNATLTNTGPCDDIYNLILTKTLPAGWIAGFCTGTICYWDTASISLKAGASQELTIYITPSNNSGTGKATLLAISQTNPSITNAITTAELTLLSIENSPTQTESPSQLPSPTVPEIAPLGLLIATIFASCAMTFFHRSNKLTLRK